MAKFIYSMQNVLNIKERMETQAKTEYAQMLGALHDEEVQMLFGKDEQPHADKQYIERIVAVEQLCCRALQTRGE